MVSAGMKSGKGLRMTSAFGNEGARMERALPQEFGTESGDRRLIGELGNYLKSPEKLVRFCFGSVLLYVIRFQKKRR